MNFLNPNFENERLDEPHDAMGGYKGGRGEYLSSGEGERPNEAIVKTEDTVEITENEIQFFRLILKEQIKNTERRIAEMKRSLHSHTAANSNETRAQLADLEKENVSLQDFVEHSGSAGGIKIKNREIPFTTRILMEQLKVTERKIEDIQKSLHNRTAANPPNAEMQLGELKEKARRLRDFAKKFFRDPIY